MSEGRERSGRIRQRLIAGVIVLAPLFVTVWVVFFLANLIAGWLARFLSDLLLPLPYPLLLLPSILILVGIIYAVGWFATTYFGKVFFDFLDGVFLQIPILQYVYRITKDTINVLQNLPRKTAFRKVVWVEMGKGRRMLGLVTDESEGYYIVFLPSTPNPTTGFIIFVEKGEVEDAHIGVEDALKALISGGLVNVFQEGRNRSHS